MTPSQEKKFDQMFEAVIRLDGKFALNDEKMNQHKEVILEHEKTLLQSEKRIGSLESDRSKVKGAIWLTSFTAGGGVLAFIYNWLKHL